MGTWPMHSNTYDEEEYLVTPDAAGNAKNDEGHGGGGNANTKVGGIAINGEIAYQRTTLQYVWFVHDGLNP